MAAQTPGMEHAGSQASLAGATPAAKPRLFYLDNLRMALITGVILVHLSVTYGVDADWIYYEGGNASSMLSGIQLMLAAIGIGFVLGLFFMI
ncbi:MAG: hypothetical protein JW910_21075, partial [Anaerolineae bacterium]|nr:hypothetical protein [Anaerolineae bacterium]